MSLTTPAAGHKELSGAGKRLGYAVAVVVNAFLLFVVNNLLAWDLLPFLTDDFSKLVPLVSFSLMASIVVNVIYLGFDDAWFKAFSQIVLGAIGLAVTVRTIQVFPFDFSDAGFDWATLTRVVLVMVGAAIAISIVVETVRLVRAVVRG